MPLSVKLVASGKLSFDKIRAHLGIIPDELKDKEVRVGYFDGVNYEDGTSVAYVATIHEFGAPSQNIPPRPTMGPAIEDNQSHYINQLGSATKAVLNGKISGDDALELIGKEVEGDIVQNISSLTSPALKQSTINRKGFSKPLVDTSYMKDNVKSEVVKK